MNATSSALLSRAQAMNAKQAWALLAAGVLGYEVVCKDGQLLSECVDEWVGFLASTRWRVATRQHRSREDNKHS
jgi:hypothetical protein